jgi:hypothetical protein
MKENRLLGLRDGGGAIQIFDLEEIEPQEIDYYDIGKKTQRFDYSVTDPNTSKIETFRANIRTSGDNDSSITEGLLFLKIRREDSGKLKPGILSLQQLEKRKCSILFFNAVSSKFNEVKLNELSNNFTHFGLLGYLLQQLISNDTLMTMTGYMLSSLDFVERGLSYEL